MDSGFDSGERISDLMVRIKNIWTVFFEKTKNVVTYVLMDYKKSCKKEIKVKKTRTEKFLR